MFLTFGTLGALLLAYRSGLIKATENFKLGVFAATGGIALVYLIGFVMSFFGAGIPLIHGSGTIGIVFSVIVVGVAALNLVLDFDFIEQGAERGAPKYMEWYARLRPAGDARLAVPRDPAPALEAAGGASGEASRRPRQRRVVSRLGAM